MKAAFFRSHPYRPCFSLKFFLIPSCCLQDFSDFLSPLRIEMLINILDL
jgi:hypothetical protein